jgi:translation elongation factor Ts
MLALFAKRSTGLNVTLLRATSACSQGIYRPTTFSFSTAGFKPSTAQVKQLRDMTGSPLKDCLKVLTETAGDIPKSKDLLRKRGLADAEKRSDRLATEGLVGLAVEDQKITMVQFSCETDFVAKTDRFRDGLDAILNTIHEDESTSADMKKTSDEALLSHINQNLKLAESLDTDVASQTIEDAIKFTISKTQENCQL